MGDVLAIVGVLANAETSVQRFVGVFVYVYVLLLLAYVLLSWVRLPYSPVLSRIQGFLYDVCDPYLRLFRRLVPSLGPIDISPIVGVFVLILLNTLIDALIGRVL